MCFRGVASRNLTLHGKVYGAFDTAKSHGFQCYLLLFSSRRRHPFCCCSLAAVCARVRWRVFTMGARGRRGMRNVFRGQERCVSWCTFFLCVQAGWLVCVTEDGEEGMDFGERGLYFDGCHRGREGKVEDDGMEWNETTMCLAGFVRYYRRFSTSILVPISCTI